MNGFLAALDNISSAPVNGLSTTGNVVWPSPFLVRSYSIAENEVRVRLFGDCPTRFIHFVKSIQLLWLVEDSVLSAAIAQTDPSITYTRAQLVGQFEGIATDYRYAVRDALAQLPGINPDILEEDLRRVWDASITPADKLAACVVHFGRMYA